MVILDTNLYAPRFYKQIKEAKAAKYLVMNNKEDRDMKGISASGMLNILQDYLPLDDVKLSSIQCR